MRISVTGGRGFIGAHVERWALEAGHDVSFFDKRDGNNIMASLGALEGAEAVIHLAGVLGTMELFDGIGDAIAINVHGSARIAEWCVRNDAQYVGILVPFVFPSIYCATKKAAFDITTALHHAKGLRVSHVTAFNAHGPGQAFGEGHPRKFGPTFSMAAWRNEPIPVWGDGTALVDPVRASDVGRMLVDAVNHPDNVVFDGGCGIEVSVNEIAEEVLKITGSLADPGIAYEPMRIGEDPRGNVAAVGRGWERLDWRPDTDWRANLRETVMWYRDHARADRTEITSGL